MCVYIRKQEALHSKNYHDCALHSPAYKQRNKTEQGKKEMIYSITTSNFYCIKNWEYCLYSLDAYFVPSTVKIYLPTCRGLVLFPSDCFFLSLGTKRSIRCAVFILEKVLLLFYFSRELCCVIAINFLTEHPILCVNMLVFAFCLQLNHSRGCIIESMMISFDSTAACPHWIHRHYSLAGINRTIWVFPVLAVTVNNTE